MATAAFDRLSLTGDSVPGSPEHRGWDSETVEIFKKVHQGISAEKLDYLDQRFKGLDPRKTGSVIKSKIAKTSLLFSEYNHTCVLIRFVTPGEFKEVFKASSWNLLHEDLSKLCQVYTVSNKIGWTDLIKDICNIDPFISTESEVSGAYGYKILTPNQ
jgi:hypothetical protein